MQDHWSFICCLSWTLGSMSKCSQLLSLFSKYYFGRCSSELAQLVPLPYSWGRCTPYSDKFNAFPVTIPKCYKDVCVNSFFPCTASRAFSNHLLLAVPTHSALFEKWNALFFNNKLQKHMPFQGCSILNALNLKKWGVQIHNCALLLDLPAVFYYTAHMPLFSRISPG